MKKVFAYISILLGAAMLVLAIALPTYVVPKGKVLPLDLVSNTKTNTVKGDLLDSGALGANRPVPGKENLPECKAETKQIKCFMRNDVELQSQRFTVAQEPSNKNVVTLEVGNTVIRKDMQEPQNLISATLDRITLDRKTQMPIPEPVSTLDITPPDAKAGSVEKVPPFTRDGVQYQFPMDADKTSYPYFDMQVLRSKPIEFVAEEEQNGVPVYRYEQTVEPTELYPAQEEMLARDGSLSESDKAALATLRLKFPASVWGIKDAKPADAQPAADGAKAEEPQVEMSRYYTVKRVIHIEPTTGVIVNGGEEIWMYYARNAEEAKEMAKPENRAKELANPTRTALYFPAQWDEESKAAQMEKATEGLDKMQLLGFTVPIILAVVGLVLLLLGFLLALKRNKPAVGVAHNDGNVQDVERVETVQPGHEQYGTSYDADGHTQQIPRVDGDPGTGYGEGYDPNTRR